MGFFIRPKKPCRPPVGFPCLHTRKSIPPGPTTLGGCSSMYDERSTQQHLRIRGYRPHRTPKTKICPCTSGKLLALRVDRLGRLNRLQRLRLLRRRKVLRRWRKDSRFFGLGTGRGLLGYRVLPARVRGVGVRVGIWKKIML